MGKMALTAGQQLQETFTMEVGALTDTITIEGELTQINTVSAQQLQSYDVKDARELPLQSRNISGLLKIASGVVPSEGNNGTGVNLNGVGRNGTVYSVDGTNATGNTGDNSSGAYQGPNLIDLLSVESVEAVSVIKGVIPAEYSNYSGRAGHLEMEGEPWGFPEFVHGEKLVPGGTSRQGWSAAAAVIAYQALEGKGVFPPLGP